MAVASASLGLTLGEELEEGDPAPGSFTNCVI